MPWSWLGTKFAAIAGLALGVAGIALGFALGHQPPQRYALSSSGSSTAWRIDTVIGELSMCYVQSMQSAPTCTPSGPATDEERHKRAEQIMSGLLARAKEQN